MRGTEIVLCSMNTIERTISVTTDEVRELIIIGSGPAGYTAAVYAARAQLKPLVFEGSQFGGALMTTTEVENYPGFTDGIMGPELMEQMRGQATRFGAELRAEDVEEVSLAGAAWSAAGKHIDGVKTVLANGVTYRARAVVLAMGAAARYLNVPGEQKLLGRGVSSCATCDGFFFRQHHIAVIGGGDSAMEEATFLTRFADSVTIVHRRDEFRASRIMLERAQNDPKIRWVTNADVVEVLGDTTVSGLRLRDTKSGEERILDVTAMFVAIGHDPRSALVKGQIPTDDAGYVLVESPSTRTTVAGVFACGDLVDHTYRQAITAAGSGCSAAIDAERWLAEGAVEAEMVGGGYGQAADEVAAATA
jgi:thioredoxin reductase (NADPH)